MARPAAEGIACQRHHVFDGLWLAWNRHAKARVATAYHPSTPTARFKDRRRSSTCVFPPAAPPLLAVQDEVRAAFGWSVEDDQDSALALHAQMSRSPLTALRAGPLRPAMRPCVIARTLSRSIPRGGGWRCSDRRGRERCGRAGDHLRRRRRSGGCGTGCVPAGGRGQRP